MNASYMYTSFEVQGKTRRGTPIMPERFDKLHGARAYLDFLRDARVSKRAFIVGFDSYGTGVLVEQF